MRARRFGWTDADTVRADDYASSMASETEMYHVVEVFDEGLHHVCSQPNEPVGVLYVVRDEDLAEFEEQHTCNEGRPQVFNTYGYNKEEQA